MARHRRPGAARRRRAAEELAAGPAGVAAAGRGARGLGRQRRRQLGAGARRLGRRRGQRRVRRAVGRLGRAAHAAGRRRAAHRGQHATGRAADAGEPRALAGGDRHAGAEPAAAVRKRADAVGAAGRDLRPEADGRGRPAALCDHRDRRAAAAGPDDLAGRPAHRRADAGRRVPVRARRRRCIDAGADRSPSLHAARAGAALGRREGGRGGGPGLGRRVGRGEDAVQRRSGRHRPAGQQGARRQRADLDADGQGPRVARRAPPGRGRGFGARGARRRRAADLGAGDARRRRVRGPGLPAGRAARRARGPVDEHRVPDARAVPERARRRALQLLLQADPRDREPAGGDAAEGLPAGRRGRPQGQGGGTRPRRQRHPARAVPRAPVAARPARQGRRRGAQAPPARQGEAAVVGGPAGRRPGLRLRPGGVARALRGLLPVLGGGRHAAGGGLQPAEPDRLPRPRARRQGRLPAAAGLGGDARGLRARGPAPRHPGRPGAAPPRLVVAAAPAGVRAAERRGDGGEDRGGADRHDAAGPGRVAERPAAAVLARTRGDLQRHHRRLRPGLAPRGLAGGLRALLRRVHAAADRVDAEACRRGAAAQLRAASR